MSNDHTSTEQLPTSNGDNQDADGCSGQGVAYNVQVRPMITPNVFNGESSEKWDEWVEHFESISRVNKWDDHTCLLWLEVMMTGKARCAWKRLNLEAKAQYKTAKVALRHRFEPDCRREYYVMEFSAKQRQADETWADLADSLRLLADKAFPEFDERAKEQLSLDRFLSLLDEPELAFSVRLQHPKSLNSAAALAQEIESYQALYHLQQQQTVLSCESRRPAEAVDASIPDYSNKQDETLARMLEGLTERLKHLERSMTASFNVQTTPVTPLRVCGETQQFAEGCTSGACEQPSQAATPIDTVSNLNQRAENSERDTKSTHSEKQAYTKLLAVNPTSAYHIAGSVGTNDITFMLDTGASVSLLSEHVWQEIAATQADHEPLNEWNGRCLVGVEGSAIPILGVTTVNVSFSDVTVRAEFIVAKSLTTEAILGLDFLEKYSCIINTEQKVLHLKGRALALMANQSALRKVDETKAVLSESLRIPPLSEVEVMARIPHNDDTYTDVCLVEALPKEMPIVVANALVIPKSSNRVTGIPLRVINPSVESVSLHKGSTIARVTQIDPSEVVANVSSESGVNLNSLPDVTSLHQEYLWDLVNNSGQTLDDTQQQQLYSLLLGFADVFAFSNDQLGRTNVLKHNIQTGGNQPVRQRARRMPPYQREEVHQLLQDMLSRDIIQPSTSSWASPIVLVKKKDGSIRFCVDYRKLNDITHKDAYPLPRIDDTLDTLSGSKWFSTLDLLSGYWQVEVAEGDREKTAFTTHEGLYEFKVMPFGLCNAPATFQRLMDLILAGVQWSQCLVYLDDIIVIGRTFSEHLQNLGIVLQKLREAGLRLKPSKCALCQESVSYLGHIVSRDGVSTDPDKTSKVSSWPTPNSVQDVQRFLGLASYYRRFVRDFATISRPLQRLTERGRKFSWTVECESAFATLKTCLTSAPVLAYPNYSKPFILDTDASQEGIGAVLSQELEGQERVIAYASRALTKAERRYSVTRKELLAVVTFIQHFRPYLLGQAFLLRTDHSSLTWLQKFKEPEGQLARWIERLQEFTFTVIHRQGKRHQNADALSRRPDHEPEPSNDTTPNDATQPVATPLSCSQDNKSDRQLKVSTTAVSEVATEASNNCLRNLQLQDGITRNILLAKEANSKPGVESLNGLPREACQLLQLWDQLVLNDGVLYRRYEDCKGRRTCLQLVAPRSMRKEILEESHAGSLGGHLGEMKTLGRVREKFFWPGYADSIRQWCKTCPRCAARKNPTPKRQGPLQSVRTGYPLQIVAADIMGPLPTSKNGNRYILVVSDYFTKWVEAYAIPNQEATTVAHQLINNMFCRFSLPEQLHSDMGAQFESRVVKEMCKLLHIRKSHTTPYHPQSDGMVERLNRTIQSMLATVIKDQLDEWEEYLPKVCLAYNTSEHCSTGFSPFYLMFGRQANMPLDIIYGKSPNEAQDYCNYVRSLQKKLETAYDITRENSGKSAFRQTELYNRKIHGEKFKTGQLVWLCNPVIPRGASRKLRLPWVGPYRIVKILSETVYRIQDTRAKRKRLVVHFDRLKPCNEEMRMLEGNDSVTDQPTSEDSTMQASTPNKQHPPGTHLQIISDCEEDTPERTQQPTIGNTRADNSTHRYPRRENRRPPTRYRDGES